MPDSFCKKNVPDVTIGEFFFKPETLKTLIEIVDTGLIKVDQEMAFSRF